MMKFLTAQRINQFRIEEDHEDDWDKQLELYEARLGEIKEELPESVNKFLGTISGGLHDADMDMWCDVWPFDRSHIAQLSPIPFQMVIRQRDWGNWKFLCILRYKTLFIDKIHHKAIDDSPKDVKNFTPTWLYDEFDVVNSEHTESGKAFTHSIIFSNGIELSINFAEFQFMYIPLIKSEDEWHNGFLESK